MGYTQIKLLKTVQGKGNSAQWGELQTVMLAWKHPHPTPCPSAPYYIFTDSEATEAITVVGQLDEKVSFSMGTNLMATHCTRPKPPVCDPCGCQRERILRWWTSLEYTSLSNLYCQVAGALKGWNGPLWKEKLTKITDKVGSAPSGAYSSERHFGV